MDTNEEEGEEQGGRYGQEVYGSRFCDGVEERRDDQQQQSDLEKEDCSGSVACGIAVGQEKEDGSQIDEQNDCQRNESWKRDGTYGFERRSGSEGVVGERKRRKEITACSPVDVAECQNRQQKSSQCDDRLAQCAVEEQDGEWKQQDERQGGRPDQG